MIFRGKGHRENLKKRILMSQKINAVAPALTGYLYFKENAQLIVGGEGYIVAHTKGGGRRLKQ
jgi:hypothetical protein